MIHFLPSFFAAVLLCCTCATAAESTLAELEEEALRSAANSVADSVVQIRTVGGLDRIGKTLLSQGPTTGLIVSEDGYIVSSAFNFAGQPSSILVRLSDGEQLAAKLIAKDKNRMLVLLKVEPGRSLPVPKPVARKQMQVGQWAIALGRTFQVNEVGVSVGIVSALNRKYGRAIQTDANISTANYGGPLVDISGQVLGVLIPMSPQSSEGGTEDELAGAEYYDSGIGFAVPLEHVLGVLPRWKQGEDLLPGKLGIGLTSGDAHLTPPKIVSVWPGTPASKAGWRPNDLVTAVNGVSVSTQADLRFQMLPLYAGDTLRVTLHRDEDEVQTDLMLTGEIPAYRHPFLGVLPDRRPSVEDEPGVVVRATWPGSPASRSGVERQDRITTINDTKVTSARQAMAVLGGLHPGETAELAVNRGAKEINISVELSTLPEEILSIADLPPAWKPNESDKEANESGFEKLMLPEFSQQAVYYSPTTDRDRRLGLLMWLGDGDEQNNQALLDTWRADCQRDGLVLLVAPPKEKNAWSSGDLDYLRQLIRVATRRLNISSRRTVLCGEAKAGQLAYAVAMKSRSAVAGVVSIDAPMPRTLRPRDASPRNRLAVLIVESKDSNFAPLIRRDTKVLRESGYPTSSLSRPSTRGPRMPLNEETRESIARWIDGLDRF